jgi:hypothetical protein
MLPRFDTNPKTRIPRVLRALETLGVAHRLLPAQSAEARSQDEWLWSRFPSIGLQIDWSKVPAHTSGQWSKTKEAIRSFENMTRTLPPTATVFVLWSDAACPCLELQLAGAVKIAGPLFEAAFDTWIFCREDHWCFEVTHGGALSFGYAPEPPSGARPAG